MTGRTKNSMLIILITAVLSLLILVCVLLGRQIRLERQHARDLDEYPVRFADEIKRYAAEYSLDAYLVLSIMRCESSFQTDALSGAGAIGLMQVMPDTGAWIAHKLGEEPFDPISLYDPETSVRYGCWYLRFVSGRFNANATHMIAAYNAGHSSVEKWLSDPAYTVNGVLTVIPFPETERYVQKVTKAYEMYTALYPDLFAAPVEKSPAP